MNIDRTSYHRTYSMIKEFGDELHRLPSGGSVLNKLWSQFLLPSYPKAETARALIGFRFFGLSLQAGLLEFRSNRFFLDSIGISLLPSEDDLKSVVKEVESRSIELGIYESFESLVDRFVEELVQSKSVSELPGIFSGHCMPVLTESDWSFLEEWGYLVVENALPLDLCDQLNERLAALARFESGSKRGGYFYGSGLMQRVYQLLGKDEIFRELLLHPICDQVMSQMFFRPTYHDKYYLTSFHGNILQPGAEPQIWHVDANVPEPLPPWIIRSNSNYVIQDYTPENGATEIIPGSHKFLRKPSKGEAESHEYERIQMCAPKGALIFWHGHLWHRSGANRSAMNRTALLATYTASFFREVCLEENPYLYFNANTVERLSQPLKRLLGWEHGAKDYG
jgi:hypothetical protein